MPWNQQKAPIRSSSDVGHEEIVGFMVKFCFRHKADSYIDELLNGFYNKQRGLPYSCNGASRHPRMPQRGSHYQQVRLKFVMTVHCASQNKYDVISCKEWNNAAIIAIGSAELTQKMN